MEIDKKTLKALSSDTRSDILKSLSKRRKTLTELSTEFNLAKSTITEHLNKLEQSDLIIKKATGRKWIYYELSTKGKKLIKPEASAPLVILLALGIIIIIFGSINLTIYGSQFSQAEAVRVTSGGSVNEVGYLLSPEPFNPLPIIMIILGLGILIFSIYKIRKR